MSDATYCYRVGKAVGADVSLEPCRLGTPGVVYCYWENAPRASSVLFVPDVDWNDAMWAADCVGLFSVHGYSLSQDGGDGNWGLYPAHKGHEKWPFENESGPRAICEAILKLAEKQ